MFDLGDENLINEIHLPEFLIVVSVGVVVLIGDRGFTLLRQHSVRNNFLGSFFIIVFYDVFEFVDFVCYGGFQFVEFL